MWSLVQATKTEAQLAELGTQVFGAHGAQNMLASKFAGWHGSLHSASLQEGTMERLHGRFQQHRRWKAS